MAASPELILSLLQELEVGDPLDFGELSLSEEQARKVVALSLAEFSADLAKQGLPAELREGLAMAVAARVLLDNLALNYRLLKTTTVPDVSAEQLLDNLATRFKRGT